MAGERYMITVRLQPEARTISVGPVSYSTNLKSPVAVSAGWYTKDEFENAGGVVPTLATAWATKDDAIVFFITKEEFQNKDKFLWVWCDPHGDGSVRSKNPFSRGDKFSGRIHIPVNQIPVKYYGSPNQQEGAINGSANATVLVTESALYFTAFAMQTLVQDKLIDKIKNAPQWGDTYLLTGSEKRDIVAELGVPSDTYEQIGAMGVAKSAAAKVGAHLNAAGGGLATRGGSYVPWAKLGSWDLKPPIFKVWGNLIRLGNEFNITQDRHLSNISYGYLCAAAGLSWQQAMTFGSGPMFPFVRDNETPIRLGHNLFQSNGKSMTKDILKSAIYSAQNTHVLLKHDDF